jgi:hypothetical protein
MHTSHSSETHYFPIQNSPSHPILLHTHGSAPYITSPHSLFQRGVSLTIYFAGPTGCRSGIVMFDFHVDWPATFGRWASRYPTTLVSWAVGVVSLVMFGAWRTGDMGGEYIASHLLYFHNLNVVSLQLLCQVFNSHCHNLGAKPSSNCYLVLPWCHSFRFQQIIFLGLEESPC